MSSEMPNLENVKENGEQTTGIPAEISTESETIEKVGAEEIKEWIDSPKQIRDSFRRLIEDMKDIRHRLTLDLPDPERYELRRYPLRYCQNLNEMHHDAKLLERLLTASPTDEKVQLVYAEKLDEPYDKDAFRAQSELLLATIDDINDMLSSDGSGKEGLLGTINSPNSENLLKQNGKFYTDISNKINHIRVDIVSHILFR